MKRVIKAVRTRGGRAYVAAVAVLMIVVVCGLAGIWVFGPSAKTNGSVWRVIVSDRWTLGLLRVGIVAVGLYAAVSVGALIASGRWIRALSTGGFQADDPDFDERLERLEADARELRQERDQAYRLLGELLNG